MPSDDSEKSGLLYIAACDRVRYHVVEFAHARGIEASLDINPGRAPFEVVTRAHRIQLTCGCSSRTVSVDHQTFMDAELFRTLVLHQLEAAIEELASGA